MKAAILILLVGLNGMAHAVSDSTIIVFDPVEGTLKPIIIIGDD